MGDPTSIGDYPEAMDNYDLVPSGLIKLIKQGFNAGMDHSGTSIGQPTSFFVGAALNLCPPDIETELKNLHRKIKAGTDFFITQPIYRAQDGASLLERYEAKYGKLNKPILAGILPLVNVRHANFLHNEVPGVNVTPEILDRMRIASEKSKEEAREEGITIARESLLEVRDVIAGVQVSAPFGNVRYALQVFDALDEFKGKLEAGTAT